MLEVDAPADIVVADHFLADLHRGSHGDMAQAVALAIGYIAHHGTNEVGYVNPAELRPSIRDVFADPEGWGPLEGR